MTMSVKPYEFTSFPTEESAFGFKSLIIDSSNDFGMPYILLSAYGGIGWHTRELSAQCLVDMRSTATTAPVVINRVDIPYRINGPVDPPFTFSSYKERSICREHLTKPNECTCGIYSYKMGFYPSLYLSNEYTVMLTFSGLVIEYDHGYRAENARIEAIVVRDIGPFFATADYLKKRYDVPVLHSEEAINKKLFGLGATVDNHLGTA